MALLAGMALFAGVGAGDSISVGQEKYDNVYIAESPSNYLICFPETGRIVSVPKSDVSSEGIQIDSERDNRRALYERWVAKRNELNGYSSLPAASADSRQEGSQGTAPSESPDSDNSEKSRKVYRIASPPPAYYSPEEAAQQARDDELKAQHQAMIEAQRRQREAAKNRMLNNRQVYTSEHARGGSVQWNNSAQWNNGGRFGY